MPALLEIWIQQMPTKITACNVGGILLIGVVAGPLRGGVRCAGGQCEPPGGQRGSGRHISSSGSILTIPYPACHLVYWYFPISVKRKNFIFKCFRGLILCPMLSSYGYFFQIWRGPSIIYVIYRALPSQTSVHPENMAFLTCLFYLKI